MIRQTHTFVILDLSPSAFKEIHDKLRAAGYDHAFQYQSGKVFSGEKDRLLIDMHGIAIAQEEKVEAKKVVACDKCGEVVQDDPGLALGAKHGSGSGEQEPACGGTFIEMTAQEAEKLDEPSAPQMGTQ